MSAQAAKPPVKITYATMSGDRLEELHGALDAAIPGVEAAFGQTHPMWINGRAVKTVDHFTNTSPFDTRIVLGQFARGSALHVRDAINAARAATNTLGSQPLVANGVAFTPDGDLYVADTARGAIWKAEFDRRGNLKSKTGCDTTFTANTLCLDNVFVAHPFLEGTDGIALDRAGNIRNSANERNAIVVVTKHGPVREVFRNPVNAAGLRNSADPAVGNNHILEFPTSPVLAGKRFCTSQSDGDRRDNSPRAAGEVNGGATDAVTPRGKISCMDQELEIPGLPLPVR